MFDGNQDFTGVQANYLKDLCELRGNVPDRAAHNNFKIFNRNAHHFATHI